MSLAYNVDPVDVLMIAVPLLAYAFAFVGIFAVGKMRERKCQALHRRRLDDLRGKT